MEMSRINASNIRLLYFDKNGDRNCAFFRRPSIEQRNHIQTIGYATGPCGGYDALSPSLYPPGHAFRRVFYPLRGNQRNPAGSFLQALLRAASEGKEGTRFFALLRQDYTLVLQKLLRFFSIYWFCVLLYFICENLFLGKEKPLSELLPNLLALSDSFNGSWWYALEYVKILLFLPLLHLLFVFEKDHEERLKKKWFFLTLFGLLALFLVLALNLFPSWEYHFRLFVNRLMPSYLLCAAGGFLIARFSLIPSLGKLCISLLPRVQGPVQEETFRRSRDQGPVQEALPCRSRRLSALLSLGGLLLMFLPFLIRYLITVDAMQTSLDFLLTPVFCLGFLLFLGDQKIPAQIFFFIGKHSVYIWLLHLMFLDGFFRDLVMASHTAIGIYLTLLFFSLLCAILLRTVYTAFSGWLLLHLKPFLHALQTAPSTSKEGENH